MARIPAIALDIVEKLAHHTAKFGEVDHSISKNRLKDMERLYAEKVTNNYWQAGTHFATAGGSIVAGGTALYFGIDTASTVSVATKFGDTGSTVLRGSETGLDGNLSTVRHHLDKGSEGGKRMQSIFEQTMQLARSLCDNHNRLYSPGSGG